MELEQEDELNQFVENIASDTRSNKLLAYMLEER